MSISDQASWVRLRFLTRPLNIPHRPRPMSTTMTMTTMRTIMMRCRPSELSGANCTGSASRSSGPGSGWVGGEQGPESLEAGVGAAQGELDLTGEQEVAMERVVPVHSDAPVEVGRRVHDPLAPVGRPVLGHRELGRRREPRGDPPGRLPGGQPNGLGVD